MQTANFSISEVLRRAREKSLTIPQFQRAFVWRDSQVKLLIDSMSRSYPIGSILLLPRSPSINLSSRSIQAEIRDGVPSADHTRIENTEDDLSNDQYYILDGQQRVTSVVRVFMDAHPKKSYYFDIKSLANDYFNEDEGTKWIVVRQKGKVETDRKENGRLLRSDVILDQAKCDIFVSEYIEDSPEDFPEFGGDRSKARMAAAKVKGIFERLRNYQLPAVTIERDAHIESVCRIFETINSTGTRLTTFDLSVATYYPQPDLRAMWDNAKEEFPVLREFEVDGERVLQVISLISSEKYPQVSRSKLLTIERSAIEAYWRTAIQNLASAYEWAKYNGARPPSPPSHNILTAIAAMMALTSPERNSVFDNKNAILRKWYFCKILQQGARQAGNYKMGLYYSELREYVKSNVLPEFDRVHLSVDKIVKLYQGADVRYKGLQSLLFSSIRTDMVSGDHLKHDELEEHHIFPRAILKKNGYGNHSIDSIVNKIPINKTTNRIISDRSPFEYFKECLSNAKAHGTVGQFSENMKSCLMPGDPTAPDWLDQFKVENYDLFLRNRAQMIIERLHLVIGDAYSDVVEPGADDMDED
ncbi:DUF262 domain-containing protein (plasmid) [Tistrella bauzanensis]|uniref:GmrSD restriction endonuclease domain-containing protein n=1 Tax=Tistrella TaxID=171436 RepID=UPI0031F64A99